MKLCEKTGGCWEDIYTDLQEAMFWSWNYVGFNELVEELTDWLEETDEDRARLWDIPFLRMCMDAVPNAFLDHVWAILVLLFGNYGVSPRMGWINEPKAAAMFLREGMERTWKYEEDLDGEGGVLR